MAEFVIKLRDLEAGEKPYRFELSRSWLERALAGTDMSPPDDANPGIATVKAMLSGRDVLVRGEVDAEIAMTCARCLGPAVVPVHAPITALFTPAPSAPAAATSPAPTADAAAREGTAQRRARKPKPEPDDADVELSGDDLDREHFTGETIALDDLVRDQLLIEVPFNPLCREDCPGIAPERAPAPLESKADVIDPRFAPLLAIKLPNKE
ncbi:MAG: DUF177 domain-containing protein [Deltaproteobacteria bacterium]|nr:DUF177 domain-containing protein [Deltaproteobacteria bacterium]